MNLRNEKSVSSFFFYMWNSWCKEECDIVFKNDSQHLWKKWHDATTESTFGAVECFYKELTDDKRCSLVDRACLLYDGRKSMGVSHETEIHVCEECGSKRVYQQVWYNPASKEYIKPSGLNKQENWCSECRSNTAICLIEQFKEIMNNWWGSIDFQQMECITGYYQLDFAPEAGYDLFVDACDKWWSHLNFDEQRIIYSQHL